MWCVITGLILRPVWCQFLIFFAPAPLSERLGEHVCSMDDLGWIFLQMQSSCELQVLHKASEVRCFHKFSQTCQEQVGTHTVSHADADNVTRSQTVDSKVFTVLHKSTSCCCCCHLKSIPARQRLHLVFDTFITHTHFSPLFVLTLVSCHS